MTKCNDYKSHYCLNACCYIARKEVKEWEIDEIGLENIIQRGDKYLLKNNPETGACVLLNEEKGLCTIYEKRPVVCAIYSCQGDTSIQYRAQEIAFMRKKKNSKDKDDLSGS